jgi:hypothetical protein
MGVRIDGPVERGILGHVRLADNGWRKHGVCRSTPGSIELEPILG